MNDVPSTPFIVAQHEAVVKEGRVHFITTRMESKSHDKGRFSTRKKVEAVLRLLFGEDLDVLSRELGVTAARLSGWREVFLAHTTGLKSRPGDAKDAEITQLKKMVGDLSMRLELSREAVRRLKEGSPLTPGRSSHEFCGLSLHEQE